MIKKTYNKRNIKKSKKYSDCINCKLELIKLKEENTKLKRLVSHDPLTGALSRTEFIERVEYLLSLFKRFSFDNNVKKNFSLVFIDLDKFKRINDKYGGHEAGDNILKNFVKFLKTNLRESDLVGRLGGDEFVLLLEESDLKSGIKVMRKIKSALKYSPLSTGDKEIYIGISCGIVSTSEGIFEIKKLIRKADQRMYKEKIKKK
jgi:diguanylate cyclase (GGDEF)-like protein